MVWIPARTIKLVLFCCHFVFIVSGSCKAESSAANRALFLPLTNVGGLSFSPNQLKAASWYSPGGGYINGYIEGSFSVIERWRELYRLLIASTGSLGINAAEIHHLQSETLLKFRNDGLAISVELPGPTQCFPGKELAFAELSGNSVGGRDLFRDIFKLEGKAAVLSSRGWFTTQDGFDYVPEEVVLDHRVDALLASYRLKQNYGYLLPLAWPTTPLDRIDPCPAADEFSIGGNRRDKLVSDFVDYVKLIKIKFAGKTKISFYWGVNAGWEWRDYDCLNSALLKSHDQSEFERRFLYLTDACHGDSTILSKLLERLQEANTPPLTVYMDADLHYNTEYALEALRRDKAAILGHKIRFGVALADECNDDPNCIERQSQEGRAMVLDHVRDRTLTKADQNMLHSESLKNKLRFLIEAGIVDQETSVRIQSWSVRPYETGASVSEVTQGALSRTALEVLLEQLLPLRVTPRP